MSKLAVGTRVQITDKYHRTGEVGYVEKVRCNHQGGLSYVVKFKDGQTSSFFESCVEERPYAAHLKKTLKEYMNIGAISSAFFEITNADAVLSESADSYSIRPVTHSDVTSKHCTDWFFKIADMVDVDSKQFPFSMVTHCDDFHVYGYFHGDKLDGIIRADEYDDGCELTWFFVNTALQRRGIGQRLFQFVLNKFADKKLFLSVYKDNAPAVYIYQKYGFKIVGSGVGAGYRPHLSHYDMQRDVPDSHLHENLLHQ